MPEINGIPYTHLFHNYREHWVRGAKQISTRLRCHWDDAGDFKRAVLGTVDYTEGNNYFNRTLPMLCPYTETLYAESMELMSYGAAGDRTDTKDPNASDWLALDHAVYEIVYKRPPYTVLSDEAIQPEAEAEDGWGELSTGGGEDEPDPPATPAEDAPEMWRFLSYTAKVLPKERRRPSYSFVYDRPDGNGNYPVIDEVGFVHDYSITYWVTWHQVPIGQVPWNAIESRIAHVNKNWFHIPIIDYRFAPETLLFGGPVNPFEPYPDAAGNLLVDLTYEIRYMSKGWNMFQDNEREWREMFLRGTENNRVYPYALAEFTRLFMPDSAPE